MVFARYQANVQDDAGAVVAGAEVAIYSETTGGLATIYSDRSGSTSITNPMTADGEGFFGFYANGDAYRIVATSGATSREFRYVGIGTASEEDKELVNVIDTTVFSGASNLVVGSIATYRRITVELERIQVATDASDLNMFVSIDGGSSYLAGTNYGFTLDQRTVSTASLIGSAGTSGVVLSQSLGTGTGEFYQGVITLLNFNDTSTYKHISAQGSIYNSAPEFRAANLDALVLTAAAITNIKIQPSAGNISGKITVKGESL